MLKERLKKITIPSYTKGEEIFNMVSHIAGGAVGITATTLCVIAAALNHNIFGIISGAVFGAMMIVLYCMSSIYHGLKPELMSKRVFRILDHCAIYLLIAGTYTPIALCTLRKESAALGWSYFGIIWTLAAVGVLLNAVDLKKFRVLSMILYLGMGWCIIWAFPGVYRAVGTGGTALLLIGGLCYTLGAVLYGLGKKHAYIHSIFHLFIVFGSILHFLFILFYVM